MALHTNTAYVDPGSWEVHVAINGTDAFLVGKNACPAIDSNWANVPRLPAAVKLVIPNNPDVVTHQIATAIDNEKGILRSNYSGNGVSTATDRAIRDAYLTACSLGTSASIVPAYMRFFRRLGTAALVSPPACVAGLQRDSATYECLPVTTGELTGVLDGCRALTVKDEDRDQLYIDETGACACRSPFLDYATFTDADGATKAECRPNTWAATFESRHCLSYEMLDPYHGTCIPDYDQLLLAQEACAAENAAMDINTGECVPCLPHEIVTDDFAACEESKSAREAQDAYCSSLSPPQVYNPLLGRCSVDGTVITAPPAPVTPADPAPTDPGTTAPPAPAPADPAPADPDLDDTEFRTGTNTFQWWWIVVLAIVLILIV